MISHYNSSLCPVWLLPSRLKRLTPGINVVLPSRLVHKIKRAQGKIQQENEYYFMFLFSLSKRYIVGKEK
jgi:hypothetical protein